MGRHSRKSSMSPSTGEFASYSSVFSHLQQDTAFGVRPEPNPKIIAADITDNADTQARINAWMVEHYAHLGVTPYDNPPTFNPRVYCTWGSDCHEFLDNYTHRTVTSTSKDMSPEDMVANCYAYQIAWLSHSPKFMDFFTMLTGKPEFADFNFDPYFDRAAQMERERIAREQATRQAQARVEAEANAQVGVQAQVVQNVAMRPVEVSKPVATNTPVAVATTPVNATKTDINGVVLPPPTAASLSRGVSIVDPNSGHNGKPTRYQVPPHAGDMSDPKPVSPVFVKHEYQGKVPDTDKVNAQGVPLPAGSEHVLDASPFKEPDEFPELNKYTTPVKKMERKLEGRDQIIKNILAQFERPEVCNVILLANAGTGKALVNGTPIAVADSRGYVPIERLKAGDEVFALDGSPASVTGVYPQGEQDVYRVHFADGSVLECNKDHVWPIVRGRVPLGAYKGHRVDEYEDDTDHTRRTGSLMHTLKAHEAKRSSSSLHVYVPANGPIERHSFISAKQRDENGYLIEDLAYLAGLAFGQPVKMCEQSSDDTCVRIKTSRDGVIRALAKDMDTPVEFAADHAMFGLTPRYAAVFNDIKRSSISPFVDMDGRLTGFVSLQSIETRLSILKGIFDARGYMVSNRALTLHVSVCDKPCAKQLLSLLSSVGIRGFMTSRVDPKRTNEYIVQVVNTYDTLMKLVRFDSHGLEARKDTLPSYSRRGVEPFGTRIVKIEKTGKRAQQTCIAVDHPSHCYLAGFMHIPTHNTATVQGTMVADPKRLYLELDLARMLADIEPDQMAAHIKMLFDEVEHFVNKYRREIVVFIDEFHQIVQLSAAAVEALKPVLAASGTRGVRVIAATTYDEFRQYVSPNQPLVERLTRMEIPEPKEDLVVKILKAFATRYGVANDIGEHVYHEIYESTNRYMPAANQPRKSLLLLDSMIGRHRFDNAKIDHDLLADCLMKQEGVNVDLKVDAASIKKRLDARVFDQSIATTAIESALQTAVAGMNDPNKPMATLLFTGSTGVGKTEVAKQLSNILFGDGHNMIRFDMSEYANADSLDRFRVHLTQSVWEHPYSVLLLDEIEKANPVITRLLLQVLDDGRLSDQNDRVVNFTNCYIILTTNGGAEIFHTMGRFDQSGRSHSAIDDQKWLDDNLSQIQRSLKETSSSFPPELLGRVGRGIIPFRTLTVETKYHILRQYMASLVARFHTVHGIDVFWQTDDFSSPQSADISNNRVERFLLSDQLDTADASAGGGREVKGVFDSMVLSKISAFVNENPESRACFVRVTGVMRAENKLSRESNAYVEVTAFDPVVDGAHAMSLMDDGTGQMVDMTGVSSSIGANTSVASGPQSLFDASLS